VQEVCPQDDPEFVALIPVASAALEGHRAYLRQGQPINSSADQARGLGMGSELCSGKLAEGFLTHTGDVGPGVIQALGRHRIEMRIEINLPKGKGRHYTSANRSILAKIFNCCLSTSLSSTFIFFFIHVLVHK
jgi:hypothetical protein